GPTEGTANVSCSNGSWVVVNQSCTLRFTSLTLEQCRSITAAAPALTPDQVTQYQQFVAQCPAALSSCAVAAAGNPALLQQCALIQAQCASYSQQYSLYQQAQLCVQQYGPQL